MYGKIFDSIYDGTLAEDWRALITFQQFIVLCDADGMVDMTPQSISRRTGIPIEHIKAGIEVLEKEDKYSRTLNEDGKRIELIDDHRPWGWHIVNHEKYRGMRDADTIRAQTRERVRKHREKKRGVTQSNAQKPHTDTDTDTDTDTKDQKIMSCKQDAINIINYLNEKSGKNFKPVDANVKFITARLNEEHTIEDIKAVIDLKCGEWMNDPDMKKYLRPATLFNATKFNQYVGELGSKEPIADEYAHYRKIGKDLGINPTATESDKDYIARVKEKMNDA